MTPNPSSAFAASQVILARPGKLYSVACTIKSSIAAADYYLILLDATSAPADATDVTALGAAYLACVPVTHLAATMDTFAINAADFGFPTATGFKVTKGCVALLSSTAPTSITGVPLSLWCNPSVE